MKFTPPILSCSNENFCFHVGDYSFGFNGKDKESEFNSGAYDFGARILDTRLGRWMSVDGEVELYVSFSPYSAMGNGPILILDFNGDKLRITVAQKGTTNPSEIEYENIARQDIIDLLPANSEYLTKLTIADDGNVTFNITEEELSKTSDPGVKLIYQLCNANEQYLYTVNSNGEFREGATGQKSGTDLNMPITTKESGETEVKNNQVLNLSKTPKTEIEIMGLNNKNIPDTPLDKNVDGQVIIAPKTNACKDTTNPTMELNRNSIVFHELWEVWERTTNKLPYAPELGKNGAHTNAQNEAKKFDKNDHRYTAKPGEVIIAE